MSGSPSPSPARIASAGTTRPRSPSATTRTASPCASTASGAGGIRATARPARPMAGNRQRRGRGSEPDLEAEGRDEALRGETEPADPLGQALPDVTEARRAEAGPEPRIPMDPEPEHREPEHREAHAPRPRKGLFGRAADFLRASWNELRRVQWPDRRQVGQGAAVVLGFVIVAGAYLGLLDAIWNPIIQKIL